MFVPNNANLAPLMGNSTNDRQVRQVMHVPYNLLYNI